MAYFTKYTVDFAEFQLLIKTNGLSGDPVHLVAGSPAVTHRWDKDEPTAPIKGSSLTANVIGVPLLDFYSDNDNQFKGELYKGSQLLFSGFLVQDDCIEDADDLAHQVTLSFTDNLGLLKDVSFGDALAAALTASTLVHISSSGNAIDVDGLTLVAGDVFTILGSGTNYGTFTIDTVVDSNSYTTTTALPTLGGFYNIAISKVNTDSKISLFAVVQACLRATGLQLPLDIFADLSEVLMGSSGSFMEQALIARESFLKSEREYDNCYAVLESVLTTFNATLIQANGQWNIIRWHEHTPNSWKYTEDFARLGTGSYTGYNRASGRNQKLYPEYGYTQRILRPYQVVKETFNYQLPYQTLKNADLKDLGTLLTTYTSGANTVKEYAFPYWFDSTLAVATATYFIRVVSDSIGNELERYIVVKGDAIMSTAIEGDQGDQITFNFSIRTAVSVPVPANLVFVIQVTDGTNTKYADEDGVTWKNSTGYAKSFNTDLTQWQSVSLQTGRLPFSGLVRVFLKLATPSSSDETHYNSLNFSYTAFINESTKIIGQTHTDTQAIATKNKSETEIRVDDSPRNFIAGTLFLPTKTGLLQNRTRQWSAGLGASKRLGELITGEIKQWRSTPRTILEGNLHSDTFDDIIVSPLNTFTNPDYPGLNLIAGTMEIDYVNRVWTGTLYELYADAETAVTDTYAFDYIYDTK